LRIIVYSRSYSPYFFGSLLDDERAQQAHRHLLGRIHMRVVHMRAGVALAHLELVREGLARLYRRLGDEGHAVLAVGDDQPVPVDRRALPELVLIDDADLVALGHADLRTRHDAVVRPRDDLADQAEDLDVAIHLVLERLAALALGLRRERLDARLVNGVHLVGGHLVLLAAGLGDGPRLMGVVGRLRLRRRLPLDAHAVRRERDADGAHTGQPGQAHEAASGDIVCGGLLAGHVCSSLSIAIPAKHVSHWEKA
jgi:hypothetical protein